MSGIIQMHTVTRIVFGAYKAISVFGRYGSVEVECVFAIFIQYAVCQFFEFISRSLFIFIGLMFFAVWTIILFPEIMGL